MSDIGGSYFTPTPPCFSCVPNSLKSRRSNSSQGYCTQEFWTRVITHLYNIFSPPNSLSQTHILAIYGTGCWCQSMCGCSKNKISAWFSPVLMRSEPLLITRACRKLNKNIHNTQNQPKGQTSHDTEKTSQCGCSKNKIFVVFSSSESKMTHYNPFYRKDSGKNCGLWRKSKYLLFLCWF